MWGARTRENSEANDETEEHAQHAAKDGWKVVVENIDRESQRILDINNWN